MSSEIRPEELRPEAAAPLRPGSGSLEQGGLRAPSEGLPPGTRLGKVEIVRFLGAGGFAQVYQVFHAGLQEHRAAKIFTKLPLLSGRDREDLRKAFYAEAQLQNKLRHPNIVRVLDVEEHEGCLVLLMEYVEGRNLRGLIDERLEAKGHVRPSEIVRFSLDIARGLEHAHLQGILHRDIKPENILISSEGSAKISDYGLGKTLNDSGQRRTTRLGNLIGTPQYMAPEQVFGEAYDHRVDLYALGAVMYHMAYGEPPFEAKDAWKILEKQRDEAPDLLTDLVEEFPPDLDRIIQKLLKKDPELRYASARDLIRDLEACPLTPGAPAPSRSGSRARKALAAGILLVASAALLYLASRRPRPELPPSLPQGVRAEGLPLQAASPDSAGPATSPRDPEPTPDPLPAVSAREDRAKTNEPLPTRISPPPSLRDRVSGHPFSQEDRQAFSRILDLFQAERPHFLKRSYGSLEEALERLRSQPASDLVRMELESASEFVRLARALTDSRWAEIQESREALRLLLRNGTVVEGRITGKSPGAVELRDASGKTRPLLLEEVAAEEFLRNPAAPSAEIAFRALSGDAAAALAPALGLEASKESALLWIPILLRLARLDGEAAVREALDKMEPRLGTTPKAGHPEPGDEERSRVGKILEALEEAEPRILPLFPFLQAESAALRRERQALERLAERKFSEILVADPGTAAQPLAATEVLAELVSRLEASSDELLAGRGWFSNNWEVRPDLATTAERIKFWDLLDDGGCVLRDPQGPRTLIMGRPHPRIVEGLRLQFEFERLGAEGPSPEWRLHLRRAGGGACYLRFEGTTLSLWTNPLTGETPAQPLERAELPPRNRPDPRHTLTLVPSETSLHVYLDERLCLSAKREDAELPNQPSFTVLAGRLSLRSILVRKKPPP